MANGSFTALSVNLGGSIFTAQPFHDDTILQFTLGETRALYGQFQARWGSTWRMRLSRTFGNRVEGLLILSVCLSWRTNCNHSCSLCDFQQCRGDLRHPRVPGGDGHPGKGRWQDAPELGGVDTSPAVGVRPLPRLSHQKCDERGCSYVLGKGSST